MVKSTKFARNSIEIKGKSHDPTSKLRLEHGRTCFSHYYDPEEEFSSN